MNVELKILDKRLELLDFRPATCGSAAIDLHACINEPITLAPGQTEKIPTGFAMHINDANMAALILPRSGKGCDGLVLANLVGLIDSDYQGQVFMTLWNRNGIEILDSNFDDMVYSHGAFDLTIRPMDAIGQLIFVPILHPEFKVVDTFKIETSRGAGGFGSTGA